MTTIDEKRVYAEKEGSEVVLVATGMGVASVSVSADQIGRFGLAHRCTARDVAARSGEGAVATDDAVVVSRDQDEFEEIGFPDPIAVGYGSGLFAVDSSGTLAEYADGDWVERGCLSDARAIDGDLVAAADGVHRITAGGVEHAGLDDANDVAAADPYAATAEGVFRLGNGWLNELSGDATAVTADGERAHAVVDGALYERTADGWRERLADTDAALVDAAHGDGAVYAITADATLLVDAGDGWRSRNLGLRDVAGIAVP
ncbi:hypothetical protein [Salarchaeum sp. JOR-1]|uniref:HVO_0234 family beta-propeller protein n=1 Tax=Salarchaeum sp. JOR-1 TaxID=2599399 RepID=UPI00119885D5|nr:hypothetical protein [Salarchaeum sp. JOR-1]QDX40331.1 hypothetical protein FQU85_05245 [Salarchaeum sp. JOR-1]